MKNLPGLALKQLPLLWYIGVLRVFCRCFMMISRWRHDRMAESDTRFGIIRAEKQALQARRTADNEPVFVQDYNAM
jgi:hypothetical protein